MTPDAVNLLVSLRARGFRLRVDGDTLYVSPTDSLTGEDRESIRIHKLALLSLVRGEADGVPFEDQPSPEDGPAVVLWEGLPSLGVWRQMEQGETPTADLWPVTSAGVVGGTVAQHGGKSVRPKAKLAHGTSFFGS